MKDRKGARAMKVGVRDKEKKKDKQGERGTEKEKVRYK